MVPARPQLIAALTQALVFIAIRAGLGPLELLGHVGLTLSDVESRDSYIDFAKHLGLAKEIAQRRPGLNVGLQLGMAFTTTCMGILGYALEHAATFGASLRTLSRYQRLINGGLVTWHLAMTPTGCRATLSAHPASADPPWLLESPLAMLVTIARELTGQHVLPVKISFRHSPLGSPVEHSAFFGIPTEFCAADNELLFDSATLRLPTRRADEYIYRNMLHLVEKRLRELVPHWGSTAEAVRWCLVQTLKRQSPSKLAIASQLAMSARTLLRRLGGEGTTFDKVLDLTRRELAVHYLGDASLAVFEIAGLLGYAEPSPFYRAFRRWYGCTPEQHRRSMQNLSAVS